MSHPARQAPAEVVLGALRSIRRFRARPPAALIVVIVVNALLISLYLWSRGGSTVDVRVEAVGDSYRVFVDGHLIVDAALAGPSQGGVGFNLPGKTRVLSLPDPAGIDSVRVTSAATGEVLSEESFSDQPSLWQAASGNWRTRDGVYTTSTRGVVATGSQPWDDYVVEAKLRNVTEATVYVRMEDRSNTVAFAMRPYRHYDTSLRLVDGGEIVDQVRGASLQLDHSETVRSIVATLLRPYPTAAMIFVAISVLAFFVRLAWLEAWLREAGRFVREQAGPIILGMATGTLLLLWYLNYVVGEAMPHVPDSVLYIFQAKIFASFNVTADAPPVRESFSIIHPHFLQVVDGRWFSHYPFAHPLFLAVGQLVGAVWLVPPVLGTASVYLTYRLGAHVYGAMVGLLAAALLLFSPFFQMTASNFMSHNTAAFSLLACLFLLACPRKHRMLSMFFAGVFLGLLFNNRPLTAAGFTPVLGAFMGYELLRAEKDRRNSIREDVAFAVGVMLLVIAYFLYNKATTGSFTTPPYVKSVGDASDWLGFGGRHSVAFGLQNEQVLLSLLVLVANGWPIAIGLFLAAFPFVLGTRNRWDYFFAASALAIAAATVFYKGAGVMHGPRYLYETMPFLMLLSARGVQRLGEAGGTVGDWLARRVDWAPAVSSAGTARLAASLMVVTLLAFGAYGWMLGKHDAWGALTFVPERVSALTRSDLTDRWQGSTFTPATVSDLDGFNFTDRRLLDAADEMDLHNALVLVEKCPVGNAPGNWWCFGSVFWANTPDLDSDVVWAEEQRTQDDLKLLEHYEGRDLYVATYTSGTIRRTSKEEIASKIEQPSPGEPATQEPEEELTAAERDQIRRLHLEQIRAALEEYAAMRGGYPDTGGLLQTLCVYRELDQGCALESILPQVPIDPLGKPARDGYWYVSDGSTFVLIAQKETGTKENENCPDFVASLDIAEGAPLYCVQGAVP